MDKLTQKKENAIITPRPPRSANPDLVPIEPVGPDITVGPDVAAMHQEPMPPVAPGSCPMNNVVEGPAQGLAGVPAQEGPAQED